MGSGGSHPAFFREILASVVVFLVALPLCLGIAVASGVPPALGLITGIIGGLIVGPIAGAPLQVSGPAAGLTVLVFEIVNSHGLPMLGPMVLAAGLLQVLAGYFRLGQWFRAVSPSVIHGMLSGIGALILVSQFHVMLDSPTHGDGLSNLFAIPGTIFSIAKGEGSGAHLHAGLIGLLTIGVMIAWGFLNRTPLRMLPAPLVAVTAASLVDYFGNFPIHSVEIPDSLWSAVSFPSFSALRDLWTPAIVTSVFSLALIASAETLLCASAMTKLKPSAQSDYDRELLAQGLGNALCGVLGAIPMTGVIVRSTANIEAGAETRLSAIFHGVWLFALVVLAPELLRHVPMASLAAVLVFTGYKLLNPFGITRLARYGKNAVVIYLITLVGVVATNLLAGVLLGVGASLLNLVQTMSGLRIAKSETKEGISVQLKGTATVFTLPRLASALESLPPGVPVRINLSRLFYLDHACMDLIETIRIQRKGTSGELWVDTKEMKFKYLRSQRGGRLTPKKQVPSQ